MSPISLITTRLMFVVMAVVALAAAMVFATIFSAEGATFNPFGSACLDDETTVDPDPFAAGNAGECDGNNAPGAVSSITTTFGVGASDSNFGAVVGFTPPEWTVPPDAEIPDGTVVARLQSQATLGLLNNSCATSLPVAFDLMDATTNQSDTVLFSEPNFPPSFEKEQFQTVNGLPRGVTEYPDYLQRILWGDNESTTLQLHARLYGQTNVSGVAVSLNFAIFEPGTTVRGNTLDPALGYSSVTVLQNGGDPNIAPAPSAITDFCSPLATSTTTFGEVDGVTIRRNPDQDGTYNFIVYTASQRDADNDGWENSLDTCPYDANHPDWDPRAQVGAQDPIPGDQDRDGIPDACDPLPNDPGNPDGGANFDHDGDTYMNRQDNCPLVPNSLGLPAFGAGPDNQKDSDGDGIGDACDQNPNDADAEGTQTIRCLVNPIEIGSGGEAPPFDFFPCGTNTSTGGGDGGDGGGGGGDGGGTGTGTGTGTGSGSGSGSGSGGSGGVGGGVDTGIGSLAPSDGNLPLWALALAGIAVAGLFTGGFMLTRSRVRDDN
ncbi:MAG TPA: thrombospondin type 3 repeat-containing protein [Dehalococcoidia bacterium]|nr:thrombospondin type 3 repeat-containing protein [Dehalococcoidia bacterium]